MTTQEKFNKLLDYFGDRTELLEYMVNSLYEDEYDEIINSIFYEYFTDRGERRKKWQTKQRH